MSAADPPIGAIVDVPVGRGVVRFAGATTFAPGKWVGIELYEPKGKNDGSVQGQSYFSCRMSYGMFVRPSQVKVITLEPPPPAPIQRTPPTVSRPTLGHQRTGSTGVARVSSMRSVPPSSPRATSPAKSGSSLTSATPRTTSRFPPPSPTKRVAAAPPASVLAARKTLAGRRPSVQETNPPSLSASMAPLSASVYDASQPTRSLPFKQRISSPPPPQPTPPMQATSSAPPAARPPMTSVQPRTSSPLSVSALAPPSSSAEIHQQQQQQQAAEDDQELHELRAKIRVFEAKRADDARHVRELETKLAEAESFVALRPKLQAKLNQQQTDLIETRRELADAKQLAEMAENRFVDSQDQLELSMLDKEVAEERAEAAEAELEELKEKLAVLEVELGVMKEGGGGEEGTDTQVTGSMAYVQLERQNVRLKEALVRLRDITQENDAEQRRRIADMEKDVMTVDDLQSQLESTLNQLANAETQVDELKSQLDDALGAEEMLMQLTERNLMLGEKIEEMRITIEDLEALKELNDELEENHVETEKAMQEEINEKDLTMREQQRKIESLEEACQDLENTIGQFRELVMSLQGELDHLRAQTQTAQNESAQAASQTAAMMSLNLKLQSTASKNQAKNIDLEIKRIEAREARELLSIVQPYLPQIYVESDSAATQCYLFFQRMALKADLINTVVAQVHGLPDALNGRVSEILVGVCDMRGNIAALSTSCKRFAAILRHCDVESFLNIGRLYPEIAPMEKRIDMHIDLLRREEFREMECVTDINKIQAQFDHLAETYFDGFEFDLGERELGFVLSLDHDLDIYASSVGLTKTAVQSILNDDDDIIKDLGEIDVDSAFFEPMQKSLDQCKSAKIISRKLTKRLEDLTQESGALKAYLAPQLKALSNLISELVNFGIQLAQQTMPYISEVRSSHTPFQLSKAIGFVNDVVSSTVGKTRKEAPSSWAALSDAIAQVISEANALLPIIMEHENVIHVTGTAPWVMRIEEIKASVAINVEAERKVTQLNEEVQGLVRNLKAKDQHIQESTVKIELMERRMETVKKQADTIADLEAELAKMAKQKRVYDEAMEQLQSDLDVLEQDNVKLKAANAGAEQKASGNANVESENIAVEGSLETSHLLEQLEAFRGAVRFLRMENSYLKGQDLLKELEELPPLPEPVSREPTPSLDPSGLSDSDDSDSDAAPRNPPTLRSLTTERKALYRDVINFSARPRIVDLSAMNARSMAHDGKGAKNWVPKKKMPAYQVWERKAEAERLSRRVQGLLERTSAVAGRLG